MTRSVEEILAAPTCSVTEAGEVLGICRASAFNAVKAEEIPSLKIGRRILVPTVHLRRMLGIES